MQFCSSTGSRYPTAPDTPEQPCGAVWVLKPIYVVLLARWGQLMGIAQVGQHHEAWKPNRAVRSIVALLKPLRGTALDAKDG